MVRFFKDKDIPGSFRANLFGMIASRDSRYLSELAKIYHEAERRARQQYLIYAIQVNNVAFMEQVAPWVESRIKAGLLKHTRGVTREMKDAIERSFVKKI
jgi:hypothetical protein